MKAQVLARNNERLMKEMEDLKSQVQSSNTNSNTHHICVCLTLEVTLNT
jgi:hypothetical protein